MHAISHYSPDVLKGHAGVALPLAFFGMHQEPGPDEDKEKSHDAALWAEVWQENVPGEFLSKTNKKKGWCKGWEGLLLMDVSLANILLSATSSLESRMQPRTVH